MPGAKTYLVPIDFSRGSEAGLNHVLTLVREKRGRIILLHVILTDAVVLPQGRNPDYYGVLAGGFSFHTLPSPSSACLRLPATAPACAPACCCAGRSPHADRWR